jgi:hypothetical protein
LFNDFVKIEIEEKNELIYYLCEKSMNALNIYAKINTLPPSLLKEIDDFVEYLKTKQKSKERVIERKFGCAKGLFVLHDDFDDSLDDFKDYM